MLIGGAAVMANVERVGTGDVNDVETRPPGIREQASQIARSGDLISAQEFLLQHPAARTTLEDEMLRAGQGWMINALASSSALPVQLAQSGATTLPGGGGLALPE